MVKFVIIFCIFWTATMGYIVWHHLEENKKWDQFLSDRKCRLVSDSKEKTSVDFGVTAEGKARTFFTQGPYRRCWICSEQDQYCR